MTVKPDEKAPKPRWRANIDLVVWFVMDQWFLIAMAMLIAIASQVQVPADKQQLRQTVVTYLAVAVIFLVRANDT